MMKCGMLSWSFRSKTKKFPRPAHRRERDSQGTSPLSPSRWNLVEPAGSKHPFLISPSPARGNQLNFRFYRSPQRAKYSARQARSSKTPPAFLHSVCTSCVIPRKLHRWCGYGRGKPTAGWFSMSALGAQGSLAAHSFIRARRGNKDSDLRALGGAWNYFWLKPGSDTGFQEGNSGLCGVRPAYAAGSRQGTRPLDPDYRLRAGLVR